MHVEGYVAVVLCIHCRPMVQGGSVIGMQCMQRAIIIIIIIIIIVTANRCRKVQQRHSSNKVEPKAYNGASGSRYTVHV